MMPDEKSEQCQLVHESLSAVRLFMKIVTVSLFFFFSGRLSRALRNITDELFVFVLELVRAATARNYERGKAFRTGNK